MNITTAVPGDNVAMGNEVESNGQKIRAGGVNSRGDKKRSTYRGQ